MKTYDIKLKSYSYDELSDDAKEKAYSCWYPNNDYVWTNDNEVTLKKFCELFDVQMLNWEYDAYNYHFRFDIKIDNDQNELSGIRLAKFVWNNYATYIQKGKFYYKSINIDGKYSYKSRYSKIIKTMDDCPLTGYCMDYEILKPIIDCLTYKEDFGSYEQLIETCLNSYFAACVNDCEFCNSKEYFEDEVTNNEWEFNEDGTQFIIPQYAKFVS